MVKAKSLVPLLKKTNQLLLTLTILIFSLINIYAEEKVEHRIAVLVNEDVITSYDIIQRLKITSIIKGVNINDQNSKSMVNNVVDELIHEKVKLNEINKYDIQIADEEYLLFENNFYERNNLDKTLMIKLLEENNIKYKEIRNLLVNELSWNKLIRGLFIRLTSVSDSEINEIISNNPNLSYEQAENLVVQRQLELQSSKLLRDIMNEATIEYK